MDYVAGALLKNRTEQGNPNYNFIDPTGNQVMIGHTSRNGKPNKASQEPPLPPVIKSEVTQPIQQIQ